MKKLLLSALALALLIMIALPAIPVYAIDDPDVPVEISGVTVYEDLLEDGDIGILINYYIDYTIAGTPDELVTESYLFVFIDTDGTTQLKAIAPYAYEENGYYRGFAWIYFSAAEVTTHGIDSANKVLHRVWCSGNPTIPSGWAGDPPFTEASITDWYTVGDSAILLAQGVLEAGLQLNYAWTPIEIIGSTSIGNRLTDEGEAYFTNAIPNLRLMAPACFADSTVVPTLEDLDYAVGFGAIATTGTSVVVASPVTLAAGVNTITVNNVGNFTLALELGTYGTIADGTANISSTPSDLVPGTNTITVTGGTPGTLTVTVALTSVQQTITDTVTGTGLDLTEVATRFGMSRIIFSGLIWSLVTILICGATYVSIRKYGSTDVRGAGSITMLVAVIVLIGGTLLGLLDTRVVAMVAIGYGALIGYMLFFRTSADIGRTLMFMGWMWFVVCLVGGTLAGSVPQATTTLTADITSTDEVISVTSTENLKSSGIIIIEDERIAYYHTTDTTITGTFWRHLVRGAQDTEAVAHTAIDSGTGKFRVVRTPENALLNNTLNYNIALLSDSSGLMLFVTLPIVLWDIITSFVILPLNFLGTDMVILTYVWALFGLGLLVSAVIAMAGGRRI